MHPSIIATLVPLLVSRIFSIILSALSERDFQKLRKELKQP